MKGMNRLIFLLATLISTISYSQTPCESGMSGPFECNGFDMMSQITLATMNSTRANDCWGWTDPQDGKEYAIVCLIEGTAFIDISDPINPVYLGNLPTENSSSTWRDAKTYNNYAFIVSEDPGHGMQIFDLTRLRNVNNPPVTFTKDAHYNGFGSAHNIVINEDTGYAYGVGTDMNGGGPHFINIQDPLNPVFEGSHTADGYSHDAQVVVYNGPDPDYTGREILFGSNEDEVVIVDVTDKGDPQTISTIDYNNVNYTHQGWLTEDHRYFLLGDEADEINLGFNTRTVVFDFEDLDNPQFHFEYYGTTGATDHNGYVSNNKFYLSNNAAGLRVMDIEDIASGNMEEVGFFDSYIQDNNAGYNGAWNVYPFFESGNIVISDRTQGFILVNPTLLSVNDSDPSSGLSIFPNPVINRASIHLKNSLLEKVELFDIGGKRILEMGDLRSNRMSIDLSPYDQGIYFVRINGSITRKIVKS
jgi:choice-of-anchor B domain-containing protein